MVSSESEVEVIEVDVTVGANVRVDDMVSRVEIVDELLFFTVIKKAIGRERRR